MGDEEWSLVRRQHLASEVAVTGAVSDGRGKLLSAGSAMKLHVLGAGLVLMCAGPLLLAGQRPNDTPPALSFPSNLPTGRVTYRTLSEVTNELEQLATTHPQTVRRFELPNRTVLGQRVWAIEISHDVAKSSGKPVFLMTGLHHAREWPTVDLTLEFVHDVLKHDGVDAEITALLDKVRFIVVPVVNPDGYEMSRSLLNEQKRKNCRAVFGSTTTWAECANPANANIGVDLNRNYGAFWGGGGATIGLSGGSARGEAPFSEPETRNIRYLLTTNQVVVALSNHTPDAKVLRVPSAAEEPVPADVVVYDSLAQALGKDLNWSAGPWPQIYYVASGTMEESAYYSAGTLAFTFEHTPGQRGFHPAYSFVVDQYRGSGAYPGSSARAAFMRLLGAAANSALHSVLEIQAPAGAQLTLSKKLTLETSKVLQADSSRGTALPVPFDLETTVSVPAGARPFRWHVNPSVRPSQSAQEFVRESWTLSCRMPNRRTQKRVDVLVERGQMVAVDLRSCR